jgi:hypothetical protein
MKAHHIARFKMRGNPKIETLAVIEKEHMHYFGWNTGNISDIDILTFLKVTMWHDPSIHDDSRRLT